MGVTQPTNDLAATLEDDGVALGVLDSAYSPRLVEFYGELGVDFVWLDLEHGGPDPWDGSQIEDLLRAGERTDVELLVRLPDTDPTLVRKALDLGVRNVFLPRVETAQEVEAAVRSGRFRYDGEPGDRGLANPRASRWGTTEEYVATEDDQTLVGNVDRDRGRRREHRRHPRGPGARLRVHRTVRPLGLAGPSRRDRPSRGQRSRRDGPIEGTRGGRSNRWTRVRHGRRD